MCPHTVEGVRELCGVSFQDGSALTIIAPPKGPTPNTIALVIRFQHEF